jgi:hypothetical protein
MHRYLPIAIQALGLTMTVYHLGSCIERHPTPLSDTRAWAVETLKTMRDGDARRELWGRAGEVAMLPTVVLHASCGGRLWHGRL